ncbi:RNA polymerase sigma factor [Desertimonas flava]|uniref:RNA polymerase sigma factor n=1 Tax=Desertimonas flava TaxID=2064846 RepID=UPI0013C4CFC4|nr:sigma-70 family RNA polymerase sigma factor [Desertimonas flava]
MRRARAGDTEAYGELVARHRPSALRVATIVLGSPADAEDVVQQAVERMWPAVAALDPHRGFRSWFLRGVANTARNHRRSRWRRARAELRLAERASGPVVEDPEGAAVSAAERAVVVAALNRLDREARLVIALRYFEQLSEREMADVLGCAPGTVKSRLSRAMTRLRAELADGGR